MPDSPTVPRTGAFALADGISLVRLPLALAFVAVDDLRLRILILVLAGASDLGDGWVARRRGGSWIGEVIDPVTDKIFMATAFGVILRMGSLAWYEVAAVLFRDLVASVAFLFGLLRGRPAAVPARLGGKVVTALQLLTLAGCLLDRPWRRPVAWLTAGAALYAIYDYHQPFLRKLRTP